MFQYHCLVSFSKYNLEIRIYGNTFGIIVVFAVGYKCPGKDKSRCKTRIWKKFCDYDVGPDSCPYTCGLCEPNYPTLPSGGDSEGDGGNNDVDEKSVIKSTD